MTGLKTLWSWMLISSLISAALYAQANTQSNGQTYARLVARSGTVEVQRENAWAPVKPGDQINSNERVRTGAASSAAIEVGPGKIITLSERTEVQVGQSNGAPMVQLETGNMKVVSAENIQVAAKETVLESAERPLDLELGYKADKLNLTVITGAVRNGPIIIRGAQDSSKRTFTAGGRWGVRENELVYYPGVYFYPYVVYANPNGGFFPQNVPPQGTVPPVVLNPTHPGYRPEQIIPPMTAPLRPPVLPFRR